MIENNEPDIFGSLMLGLFAVFTEIFYYVTSVMFGLKWFNMEPIESLYSWGYIITLTVLCFVCRIICYSYGGKRTT